PVGVQVRVELGAIGAGLAVLRPALHEVRGLVEVIARVDVVVLGRHHVVPPLRLLPQLGGDPFGHRRPALDRQRTAFAEVVLYVHNDECLAHLTPPQPSLMLQRRGEAQPSPESMVTGIAGSPAESFSPSQGTATSPERSSSRAAARSGRSGTGSPRIRNGRCSNRSCGAGGGVPRDTTTSSVAVPVGLWRRTAVLRPPIVALRSDRFTTGAPSTSTSL